MALNRDDAVSTGSAEGGSGTPRTHRLLELTSSLVESSRFVDQQIDLLAAIEHFLCGCTQDRVTRARRTIRNGGLLKPLHRTHQCFAP